LRVSAVRLYIPDENTLGQESGKRAYGSQVTIILTKKTG